MFPVKIFDGKGNFKTEISGETVREKAWSKIVGGYNPVIKEPKGQEARKIICAKEGCEKTKIVFSHNARYCSTECGVEYHNSKIKENRQKRKVNKKCRECGKEFEGFGNRSYCNDPCSSRFKWKYVKITKTIGISE